MARSNASVRRWAAAALAVVAGFVATGTGSAQEPEQPAGEQPGDQEQDPTAELRVNRDEPYATVDGVELTLDAYIPPGPGPRPAIVLVHGGGWRRGQSTELRDPARHLAGNGLVVFAINYRLDIEPGHPAEVEDVERAVRWVREHAGEFGVDPRRVALAGGSAGGNLALLAATRADGPLDEGSRVAAVAALSAPTDLAALTTDPSVREEEATTVRAYLGCAPDACADLYASASPISHVSSDDPPMLLVNADEERIPVSQAEAMAARAEEEGVTAEVVVIEGDRHGEGLFVPAQAAIDAFLAEQLDAPPVPRDPGEEAQGDEPETTDTTDTADRGDDGGEDGEVADEDDGIDVVLVVFIAAAVTAIALAVVASLSARRRRRRYR